MIICPVDGEARIVEGENPCHQCGADLSAFWQIRELPDLYYNEGVKYAHEGLFDIAIEKLTVSIALNPESADSYVVLGKIYIKMGLCDKALSQMENACRINPENKDLNVLKEKIAAISAGNNVNTFNIQILIGKMLGKIETSGFEQFFPMFFIFGIISSFFSIFLTIIFKPHISDLQLIKSVVAIGGFGLLLMLIGTNSQSTGKHAKLFSILGIVSSLTGIILFYRFYETGWYYPVVGYVGIFYTFGILTLVVNLFIKLGKNRPKYNGKI